jgi:hypothetical protein
MNVVQVELLIGRGAFARSQAWHSARHEIVRAVREVGEARPGGGHAATQRPRNKPGTANTMQRMKQSLMANLQEAGWQLAQPLRLRPGMRPRRLDAVRSTGLGLVAAEWKTGHASWSHVALNHMTLALLHKRLAAGVLILPSADLCRRVNSRAGNWSELEPYLGFWRALPCSEGALAIIVVE